MIEIHTASFRSTRGYSIIAALCDELAYWPSDEHSSEPDFEIINAIRPGMATIPGAMLLCASSPHARKGALWSAFSKHYGKDGDPFGVAAATREMNRPCRRAHRRAHGRRSARASRGIFGGVSLRSRSFVQREVVEKALYWRLLLVGTGCQHALQRFRRCRRRQWRRTVLPRRSAIARAIALSSTVCVSAGRRFRLVPSSRSWCRCCGAIASTGLSVTDGVVVFRRAVSTTQHQV